LIVRFCDIFGRRRLSQSGVFLTLCALRVLGAAVIARELSFFILYNKTFVKQIPAHVKAANRLFRIFLYICPSSRDVDRRTDKFRRDG
jgi:hypothetical protein